MTDNDSADALSEPIGSGQVIPFPTASLPVGSSGEELLAQTYARLSVRLTEYAAHYVGRDEAADVVQQAFQDLWHRHLSGERVTSRTYDRLLFHAIRFHIIDYRRTERRRKGLMDLGYYAESIKHVARRWMEPQAAVETDDFNKTINAALEAMPPRTREVQALYRKAELSVDEICATTGLARESVRTLLQRGNRILRDHLDRAGYSPESRRQGAALGRKVSS